MAESGIGEFDSVQLNCTDLTDNVASTTSPNIISHDQPPGDHQKEIRRLQFELDEARSLVAVANYSLEESIETERRKCQEEVATLQQLMKGKNLLSVLYTNF